MTEADSRVLGKRSAPPRARVPKIYGSPAAVAALLALRTERGRYVLTLNSACTGLCVAHICPEFEFTPTDHHVQIGAVAQCSVYAERSRITLCPHDELMLDLRAGDSTAPPLFMTRPASAAESQQRLFSACARGESSV
jgi:uncharacterized protein (DUF779 family)